MKKTSDILSKYKPDEIITFNNRFASSLPIILAAEREKLEF